jgi:hypothetical protein
MGNRERERHRRLLAVRHRADLARSPSRGRRSGVLPDLASDPAMRYQAAGAQLRWSVGPVSTRCVGPAASSAPADVTKARCRTQPGGRVQRAATRHGADRRVHATWAQGVSEQPPNCDDRRARVIRCSPPNTGSSAIGPSPLRCGVGRPASNGPPPNRISGTCPCDRAGADNRRPDLRGDTPGVTARS